MEAGTVQVPNQLAQIQQLLSLISGGGQTVTTSPGNIDALQQVLAQLQGADYQALLQSIFQQAAGAIPGIQRAHAHAVGARSGNNSAAASALEQLLKVTTLEGQRQVADQRLRNQELQTRAGSAVAEATAGTQQTTKPNSKTGSQLGDLAAMLGLLKGAQALTGANSVQEMLGMVTNRATGASPTGATAPATTAQPVRLGGTPTTGPARLNAMGPATVSSAPMPMNMASLANQFSLAQPNNAPRLPNNAPNLQQSTAPTNQFSLVQPGAPAPQFNAMPIQQATTPIDQFSLVQPGMATPTFNANWW